MSPAHQGQKKERWGGEDGGEVATFIKSTVTLQKLFLLIS